MGLPHLIDIFTANIGGGIVRIYCSTVQGPCPRLCPLLMSAWHAVHVTGVWAKGTGALRVAVAASNKACALRCDTHAKDVCFAFASVNKPSLHWIQDALWLEPLGTK